MTNDQATAIVTKVRSTSDGERGTRKGKMYLANHKGDETIATFEPGNETSCEVAQEELTNFLTACVAKYGVAPPVWQRRMNESEFSIFNVKTDRVIDAEEVFLQYPMAGG